MPNGYDTDLMEQRAHEVCEICKVRQATEWHHCLIHRMAGRPELNRIYNLEHVCHECHEHANGYEHRRAFWWTQFKRYGVEFTDWWDGLDFKVTVGFDAERSDAYAVA